ncbi:S8 family serine peptidase [Halobaculum magnesiiphilum]|uniref:S8 family serine peptidase n=1 Tax=Halobaculum magnesiiphilum TaxID=1017351 RepID=A0A8T8WFA7_9EURY|nr:S8 family serine peptidase [Halobaculum magnesiiphilum]QZP38520.1 S8 family serine peptidase [Halobaculum magnesiiphilum]
MTTVGRTAALLTVVIVVASAGTGLVGADVTHGSTAFVGGNAIPGYGDLDRITDGSGSSPATGSPSDREELERRSSGSVEAPVDDGTVRVGVIGSSFGDDAAVDGRVVARSRAGTARVGLVPGGRDAGGHDTAVASVVAQRAPESSLYLASVGYEPTPAEYARAVDWLVDREVDVIVDAGSYYPRTAEGMDRIAGAAERATDDGTVFVTSGGNTAQRHWRGAATEPGWLAFDDDGTQGNRLGDGAISGAVTLRLYWTGSGDYDLYLYRDVADGPDEVVAKSTRESGRAEAFDAVLPRGSYYVAVDVRDPGDGHVDLFAARHRLAHSAANGSTVAPATAGTDGVISVGAVRADGRLAAYSPADTDVRAAGTVTLPDGTTLRGTSAAAPAVAGVVAEMTAAAGEDELTPAEAERLLRETAVDGRIDPGSAVAAASAGNRTGDDASTADGSWVNRGP